MYSINTTVCQGLNILENICYEPFVRKIVLRYFCRNDPIPCNINAMYRRVKNFGRKLNLVVW